MNGHGGTTGKMRLENINYVQTRLRFFLVWPFRYLRVGGLVPIKHASQPPAVQCEAVLESFEAVLHSHGMPVRSVARTWYFLDQILAWYPEFNTARNAWFTKHKVGL